jgi:serralysin
MVFIDNRVVGYESLTANLSMDTEWYLLNGYEDGIEQILRILENYAELEALQIISHGAAGKLYLGSTVLSSANLSCHHEQLQLIGASLTQDGDILLYGCDVAQGEVGLSFINSLAAITGADVTASSDPSGPMALGADSNLEIAAGSIEATSLSLENLQDLLAANSAPTYAVGDGIVTTAIGSSLDAGQSVTVQADGKILVAGYSFNGVNTVFTLVRYNTDGSLDASFSHDGIVTTAIGSWNADGNSAILQSDGKIVVVGTSFNGSNFDFAVVRYNTDGSLDTTFSGDGKLTTSIGTRNDFGYSATIQSDGKILVAGTASVGGTGYGYSDFALVRYNSDGSLDTTFSDDGKLTTNITSEDEAKSVTLQADGKILIAGFSRGDFNNEFSVVRYNTNGSLDTSFSQDGKLITRVWGDSRAYSITVQADGKILVAGSGSISANNDFALVRYNTDGTLDTTFSGDGKIIADFYGASESAYSVTLQSDGKILVAGNSGVSESDFFVLRYNIDGSLDASFGFDGSVITDVGSYDHVRSMTLQSDGKILVAGYAQIGSNYDFALVRYNTDGSLDSTFDPVKVNSLDGLAFYTENGSSAVLDHDVQIYDPELHVLDNYSGSTLTLARHGGASSQDLFSGSGIVAGQANGNVTALGIVVGTYVYTLGTLTVSFNNNATQTLVNLTLQSLAYSSSSDAPSSSVAIDWVFNEGNTVSQGTDSAMSVTGSTNVNIIAVNDAPTVASAVPILATISEDIDVNTNAGQTVASLLGGSLNDVDANALQGIALYAVTGNSGAWQFKLEGSSVWSPVGMVSETAALLLRVTDLVRWQPDGTNGTTATFSYYAWDQTSGTAGSQVSVGTRGGTTAFSSTGESASIAVTDVDDFPILANAISDQNSAEDSPFTCTLASNTFDAVDAGESLRYAARLSGGGELPAWLSFDSESLTFSGTPVNSDVGYYDVTVTATDTSNAVVQDTFRINISNVNDAPVLTVSEPMLSTISEDANTNSGQTVASILGSSLNDIDTGHLQGVAIHGLAGSDGAWQYSIDGGSAWTDVGSVSKSSALLLRSTDLVRWLPDGTLGTTATISYYGWDQTSGAVASKVSTAIRGGTSALSLIGDTASLSVTSLNDAPFFGSGNAIVTTSIDGGGSSVALQPDGKILVAGSSYNGVDSDFALVRYNSDGSLDTTFSEDGKLTTSIGMGGDSGQSVIVQSDGKILVAGTSQNGSDRNFALVRYNTDGSLDTSFTTTISTIFDDGRSVSIQSDGKILLAGYSYIGRDYDFALMRYNSDGTLDATFSDDGKLTTSIGTGYDIGASVAIQGDGKILVAGSSHNGTDLDWALVRYNSDGSLDNTFNGTGKVITAIGSGRDLGQSLIVQTDGKIMVAGSSSNGANDDFALARYNPDGSLDTTFNGNGKVTTAIGAGDDVGYSVTLQSDGKILVSGSSFNGANDDFALVRYNTDGSLDATFSDDGLLTTSIGSGGDLGFGVTVQPNGEVLVAGSSDNGASSDFALVRYNPDGSLVWGGARYTENEAPVILASAATIFDTDLNAIGQYAGASITLSRHGGANVDDLFSISGGFSALTEASLLVYGATTIIGTVTKNSGGALSVRFNSNATQSLVNKTLQSIAYSNSSDNPSASVRIDWIFSDGNAGNQGSGGALGVTGFTMINITSINDAPNGADGQIRAQSNTTYTLKASDLGFSDAEDGRALTAVRIDSLPIQGKLYYLDGWLNTTGLTFTAADLSSGNLIYWSANGTDRFRFSVMDAMGAYDSSNNSLTFHFNSLPTGNITISGTPIHGRLLTATNNLIDADGLGALRYQWRSNGNNISGATGSTYKLTQSEVGKTITVVASYTDQSGSAESVVSGATALVTNTSIISGGSGNDLLLGDALANTLLGNSGNDTLRGGLGKDILDGGTGADTADYSDKTDAVGVTLNRSSNVYVYVKNVIEDTIRNIENITGGSGADLLVGDTLANVLKGGSGNDTLRGGLGKDTLYGGSGADRFIFDSALSKVNADTIKDFQRGIDKLVLDDDIFTKMVGKKAISSGSFIRGTKAVQSDDFFIYNTQNDMLYYDADGSGSRYGMLEVVKIELGGTNTPLSTDFIVVG